MVLMMGIEPTTYALPRRCATDYATSALMARLVGFEPTSDGVEDRCPSLGPQPLKFGVPGEIRTPNLVVRSHAL